jgi:hypothetical protein
MNKLAIIPIFFLTMCGTAPITDDAAHAFELEIEESQWNYVYSAIEYIKAGQREKTMTDPTDSIDSALADFWSQETSTELEE